MCFLVQASKKEESFGEQLRSLTAKSKEVCQIVTVLEDFSLTSVLNQVKLPISNYHVTLDFLFHHRI